MQVLVENSTISIPQLASSNTIQLKASFTNATCAVVSLIDESDAATPLAGAATLSLLTVSDFSEAIANLSNAQSDINQRTVKSCVGNTCNATAGTWLLAADLQPDEQYILIQQLGSLAATEAAPGTHSIYMLLQVLTEGENLEIRHKDCATRLAPCCC